MKMKNKMKDSEAKFEEWWELAEEYLIKELEKNMAQHRVDERIMRYKLEAHQKNFLDFMCGNLISTEISSRDEDIEVRPNVTAHEEEM
jgi:hypothetical protein